MLAQKSAFFTDVEVLWYVLMLRLVVITSISMSES